MLPHGLPAPSLLLVTLALSASAYAQDREEVCLMFLQRHAVPCKSVVKVDVQVLDEVVTCEDGRQWALYWLEGEVAFFNARHQLPYRWNRQVYLSYPEIYGGQKAASEGPILVGDER